LRKWLPLVSICLGTFMLLIDVTIVNVALPDMVRDLSASFESLQWVIDAYALVLAALVLGVGSISDSLGHRQVYVAGLALFAVASLVCGLAPNSATLIAARAVQGLGGAAMFATTIALVSTNYNGRDRGVAFGVWGAVAGGAAALGPIVGGLLTEGISWRWIFFVNLPVSVLAIGMGLLVLTDVHAPRRARADVLGIATFTLGAAGLTDGMIHANEHGWGTPGTYGMLAGGIVFLALFVVVELRTRQPMLDLALLRNRAFAGVMLAALLFNFVAFAYLTYTAIWTQSVLGLTPIQSGLTFVPLSAASFLVAGQVGRFLHGARPGPLLAGGMLLLGAGGLLDLALLHGAHRWPWLSPGYVVVGVGVGLMGPTLGSAALSAVPPQRGGMASGAVNTLRQLGYAFGIALLGTVFTARAQSTLTGHGAPDAAAAARALAGGQTERLTASVPPAQRGEVSRVLHLAAVHGLQGGFLLAGAVGVLCAAAVYWLMRAPQPAGEQDGGPRQAPAEQLPEAV